MTLVWRVAVSVMTIELYGVLKEAAGRGSIAVDLGETTAGAACSVDDVLTRLVQQVPELQGRLDRVACAQGVRVRRRDQTVDPDQPLVLLPPVSGG